MRTDNRELDQLREVKIKTGWNPYAEGSVEVSYGNTKILVTASVLEELPKWKEDQSGWITAEYSMLPRATHTRGRREQKFQSFGDTKTYRSILEDGSRFGANT